MSQTVIKVENLGKQYHLGQVGTGTMMHDVNRWWFKIRGKEDPYLKIGDVNDRATKGDSEYVWSLRDINFEVKQGEVLGIIGKNGAGKSTLLKILSRVTNPTVGNVKIKGRVASLLEVGTGFHPELTGRENIFLNGAILGMSKQEIRSKFDEMLDFSGVERYIDTPVKRYSSGMYVRLAFAVAAHLEPEILIVDEVLAVGDAEFQKKCLGKMKDVSGQGRTVLFVSHQLGMINYLCTRGIVLSKGSIVFEGGARESTETYLKSVYEQHNTKTNIAFSANESLPVQILSCRIMNKQNQETLNFDVFENVYLEMEYIVRQKVNSINLSWVIEKNGEFITCSFDTDNSPELLEERKPGIYKVKTFIPAPIKGGRYNISSVGVGIANVESLSVERSLFTFDVEESSYDPTYKSYSINRGGYMVSNVKWEITDFKELK